MENHKTQEDRETHNIQEAHKAYEIQEIQKIMSPEALTYVRLYKQQAISRGEEIFQ